MNEIAPIPTMPDPAKRQTTQAAEGLPRFEWTLTEFERLSELGFFDGIDGVRYRVELIDGEIVPMQAKGRRHEWVRGRLGNYLMRRLPEGLALYSEPGWRPGGNRYVEPEFIVCDERIRPDTVPAGEVLLLMEVADTSRRYDTGTKSKIYASAGVREYWVVDAVTLSTRLFREPSAEGYGAWRDVPPEETLTPHLLPTLAVSLGGLGIG